MQISMKSSMNIISMLVTFMVCAAVPKMILADIPLGDQHCGDPKCIEPISVGRTVLKYRANSNLMLSFNPSTPVKIFSKDLNDGGEIWGVEIEGKRGFVNRRHIQETRIFKSQLGHRISEGNGSNSDSNEPVNYVIDKRVDEQPNPDGNNDEAVVTGENVGGVSEINTSPDIGAKDIETKAEATDESTKEQVDTASTEPSSVNYDDSQSKESRTESSNFQDPESHQAVDSDKISNHVDKNILSNEDINPEHSIQEEQATGHSQFHIETNGAIHNLEESKKQTQKSENENAHVQQTQSTQKEDNTKDENSEVPTADLNAQEKIEVIDGTTIYIKTESTAEIKKSEYILDSSFVPGPSILTSNIVSNENTPSATKMNTVSVVSYEQESHSFPGDSSLSTASLTNDEKELSLTSTQEIDEKHIISSKIDIHPSITEQKTESDLPTPRLQQFSQKFENSKLDDEQEKNIENIQPAVTSNPGQHVSTENTMNSILTGDNIDDAVVKTDTDKPNSELHTIPSTETPTIYGTQSNEIESNELSQSQIDNTNTDKMSHEEVTESSTTPKHAPVNEVGDQLTDNSVSLQTHQDEIEDIEDHDDDEEIESEEIKEERKKIIQQSLQVDSKTDLKNEFNEPDSPVENMMTNESPSTVSEQESQPAEPSNNDNIESSTVDKNVLSGSNEDKGLFGSLFGSSTEEKNDQEQNEENTFTEGMAERESNPENDLIQTSYTEEIEEADHSGKQDTFNTRPGDDIKFYEPGDMLPSDIDIRSSGNINSQNENMISDKNMVDMEEPEGYETEKNELPHDDNICCRAMTADCLACTYGKSVAEYCAANIDTIGCEEYQAEEGSPPKEDLQKYDNGYQAPAVEEEAKSNDINIEGEHTEGLHAERETMDNQKQRDEEIEERAANIEIPQSLSELNNGQDQAIAIDANVQADSDIPPHEHTTESILSASLSDDNLDNTLAKDKVLETAEDTENLAEETKQNNEKETSAETLSFSQDIFLHIIESVKDITPEWLHKSLHGENVEDISPKLVLLLGLISTSLVFLHVTSLVFDKISREKPLLAKIAALDKSLFKARNELMMVRKELDEARSKMSYKETAAATSEDFTTSTVVGSIKTESPTRGHFNQPATHILKEIESLKMENDKYEKENQTIVKRNQEITKTLENKSEEVKTLGMKLEDTCRELKDAENMVKEVLEKERERQQAGKNQDELVKAIDTLRIQLDNQKKSVQKYESKIAKREIELKGKVQEVRKLRADAANANLAVDKVTLERENLAKLIEQHKSKEEELQSKLKNQEAELIDFHDTKSQLITIKDDLDIKESELEAKCREISVLSETLQSLTCRNHTQQSVVRIKKENDPHISNSSKYSDEPHLSANEYERDDDNTKEEDGDGWDDQSFDGFGDEDNNKSGMVENLCYDKTADSEVEGAHQSSNPVDERIVLAVKEMAQYKVDLSKATEACEQLNSQLTIAENEKHNISNQLSEHEKELQIARAAKDEAVRVKIEIEQKHQVLTDYYNQREAELQKQLGLLSSKLGDANEGSESSAKKLTHLFEELESYKAQCKSYKAEMEEQERSLKSQNALLEKRHHESWVTVRQESRKNADAQNEMQTLRNRLTVAETKLLEREVEIKNYEEETKTLKDAMENLAEKASVASQKSNSQQDIRDGHFANGTTLLDGTPMIGSARANGISSSEGGSLTGNGATDVDIPPPDLPPLPMPSMPHGVYPHVPVVPPMGLGVIPSQFQAQQQPMSNFPADIMRRPPPLGRRSPPRGSGGQMYSRSPSPPPNEDRYTHKTDRRHNLSSARSDTSNRGRTRRDRESEYDSYGTSGLDHSPPPSPRYSHNQGQIRRSSKHSPDRYSSRSGQSGSEWTDREYYENDRLRRREHKSGTPLRDDRHSEKRKQRAYMENGATFEEDYHGYASGSSNHRDRPNHHSGRREKAVRDDSISENMQGKHGPKTSSPMV